LKYYAVRGWLILYARQAQLYLSKLAMISRRYTISLLFGLHTHVNLDLPTL
jgi:hypothetical protein